MRWYCSDPQLFRHWETSATDKPQRFLLSPSFIPSLSKIFWSSGSEVVQYSYRDFNHWFYYWRKIHFSLLLYPISFYLHSLFFNLLLLFRLGLLVASLHGSRPKPTAMIYHYGPQTSPLNNVMFDSIRKRTYHLHLSLSSFHVL